MLISQIEKFGDPNGIVQFAGDSLQERVYNESTEAEGQFNISLLITRREGVMGNITVRLHHYALHFVVICIFTAYTSLTEITGVTVEV